MTVSAATIKAMQLQIDTLADKAVAAEKAAVAAADGLHHHEDICGLRYEAIALAQDAQTESLKSISASLVALDQKRSQDTTGIYNRFWWFAAGIGSCMFAIIMALIFKN